MKLHECKICILEYGVNSDELDNETIDPRYKTVCHWYDARKENYLGSLIDTSVLQVITQDLKID